MILLSIGFVLFAVYSIKQDNAFKSNLIIKAKEKYNELES